MNLKCQIQVKFINSFEHVYTYALQKYFQVSSGFHLWEVAGEKQTDRKHAIYLVQI